MTINRGPVPTGRPKSEAINHYAQRAQHFEGLVDANGAPKKFGVVLGGLHFVEIDPIGILDNAAKTEMADPEPQCAAPMGQYHCVKYWRHPGDHLHI